MSHLPHSQQLIHYYRCLFFLINIPWKLFDHLSAGNRKGYVGSLVLKVISKSTFSNVSLIILFLHCTITCSKMKHEVTVFSSSFIQVKVCTAGGGKILFKKYLLLKSKSGALQNPHLRQRSLKIEAAGRARMF